MLIAVTFLTLLTNIPYSLTIFHSCIPNSHFILNGRICYCSSLGQLNEATCHLITRRQACYPGQIIWEDCKQCICQENGNLLCTNTECAENRIHNQESVKPGAEIWCTPFRSYYVNCTLCVCPASGKMSEARCAKDTSCVIKGHHTSYESISQYICIPKVMYLFTCLQCQCLDDGIFLKSKCVETCQKTSNSSQRCIRKSFYKTDCNICYCPETGIPDINLCSKSTCTKTFRLANLNTIRSTISLCAPNKFTKPRCIYCECNPQGHVNEQACMEQECLKMDDYNYETIKATCSPGEMVASCMECFCLRSKLTAEKFCTKVCSNQNKIAILENVLKDKIHLIDRNLLKETSGTDTCDANSLFLDQGRYCLCSEDGNTAIKHCTSVLEYKTPRPSRFLKNDLQASLKIDYNGLCESNTYVEFGCNFCFCPKNGKIDQKWCTSDYCKIKNVIHENHKDDDVSTKPHKIAATTCVPGSVTKNGCNFCICGNSGLLAERTCTKDFCDTPSVPSEDFNCEPSSYYTVDCNVCICPSDGIKNVEKCTKNQCETNFLRSKSCTPGELFSDDCNICVCPPNGQKIDKICTKKICSDNDTPWKNIFKISQSLLESHARDETRTSSQDFMPCFPGEEFEVGCKICVCPDMGLKAYATCTAMLCDEQNSTHSRIIKDSLLISSETLSPILEDGEEEGADHFKEDRKYNSDELLNFNRRQYSDEDTENCMVYNLTESNEKTDCTPGSEYIIRCRICICPYMGNINRFCRPMPADRYCEKAFPGVNFVPMGRRQGKNGILSSNTTTTAIKKELPKQIYMPHNHTEYRCDKPGRLQDDCFICECKDNILMEEHCFKSDDEKCKKILLPSFIKIDNKLHHVYMLIFIFILHA